jgi:hypothetical protein
MRKITEQAITNFYNQKQFNKSNTKVVVKQDCVELRLHDNLIAVKDNKGVKITDAGWDTRTTFERLNGLQDVNIHRRKGDVYLNDHKWDGSWIYI